MADGGSHHASRKPLSPRRRCPTRVFGVSPGRPRVRTPATSMNVKIPGPAANPDPLHLQASHDFRLRRNQVLFLGENALQIEGAAPVSCSHVRAPTVVPLLQTSFVLTASRHPPCPSLRLLSPLPNISFLMLSSCPCWVRVGALLAEARFSFFIPGPGKQCPDVFPIISLT